MSPSDSSISVIIPVFDRDDALRRALRSVLGQTRGDFECIVVDDASTVDIAAIVEAFEDPRLRVIRRERNGGPYAARISGLESMTAGTALFLDSDDELYPWALAQAHGHLKQAPSVDIVCALIARNEDSVIPVRVRNSPRVVTPDEARYEPQIPDRVAAVRMPVIEHWLSKDPNYFALEAHQYLTAKLQFEQLYVDEPWMLCHIGGSNRVSTTTGRLDDHVRFLAEHRSLIEDQRPYLELDRMVKAAYVALARARRPEARDARRALEARGISPSMALAEAGARRMRAKLRLGRRLPVTYA